MKLAIDRGRKLETYSAEEKADLIEQSIAELFDEETAVRFDELFPDGRNLQQVQKSQKAAEAKRSKAKPPTVTRDADSKGNVELTISGDYGTVVCDVRKKSIVVEYEKTKDGQDTVEGSSLFTAFDTWASLSRWASIGEHKFTDK